LGWCGVGVKCGGSDWGWLIRVVWRRQGVSGVGAM